MLIKLLRPSNVFYLIKIELSSQGLSKYWGTSYSIIGDTGLMGLKTLFKTNKFNFVEQSLWPK